MITLPPLRDIPVFVFRSTDNDAPILKGEKGSLKTVLKACLVNGYGEKGALGWRILNEDTNTAIFQSNDNTSNKHLLKIDHDAGTHFVRATGGTGLNGSALQNVFGQASMSANTPVAYGSNVTPWVLVGHSKAFVLLLGSTRDNQYGSVLYFGDIPSLIADDMYATCLWATRTNGTTMATGANANLFVAFPANYKGIVSDTADTPITWLGTYNGSTFGNMGTFAPNESNQLLAAPVAIRENPVVRGLMSGIVVPSLLLPAEWNLNNCPLPEFEDYIVARFSENSTQSNILVNTVAWQGV